MHIVELYEDNLPRIMEQCRLFKCADLIVGSYSKVFGNVICSRRGTSVFEYHMLDVNPEHFYMSRDLQLQYHGLGSAMTRDSNVTVPLDSTAHALRQMKRDRAWAISHNQ